MQTDSKDLKEQVSDCLGDLRQVTSKIRLLEEQIRFGSQAHRGLQLIERDLTSASDNLERLRSLKTEL
jgi:hypothetical protein